MPRKDYSRTVYTTETGRVCPNCSLPIASCTCGKKKDRHQGDGVVRITLEKKGRGGKVVSVITGLVGSDDDLRDLVSELKRRCGSGGTLKNGVIEIQGDHRDTLVDVLKIKGMNAKKAGG